MRATLRLLAFPAAGMITLVAGECQDDPTPPELGEGILRVLLDHVVADQSLVQNQMIYTTAEGNDYSVAKLRYVVSRVELEPSGGGGSGYRRGAPDVVHLRDVFNDASRVLELDGVAEGRYTAISFVFGLTEEMNAPDATYTQPGLEDEWVDMRWQPTWGGGYHYMKLEGSFVAEGGATEPYATHTGRRNAQDDPTFGTDPEPIPHFFTVTLPIDVRVGDGDEWEIQVIMDVNEWYEDPNAFDLDTYPRMIMMNTDAQTLLEANGATVFSLGTVKQVN